jgi:hypothetical protein
VAADPQQGPAYDPTGGPQPPVEAPPEGQAPLAEAPPENASVEGPGPRDDVVQQVKAATVAAAMLALAFGTGEPDQIDVQSLDATMGAVLKGCQAIAVLDPPAQPLAPKDMMRLQLDSSRAVLQDRQHADQMAVQRETAVQREGRPQGPAKP